MREAVAHRESVEAPALASRPGRSLRIALSALLRDDAARSGVVTEDVETAVVGPEVVLERVVGVGHGDVAVAAVAGEFRGEEEHFEVHHVVDDHAEGIRFPVLVVPRADQSDGRVEPRDQRFGRVDHQLFVIVVPGQAVGQAARTTHHESHVVGLGVVPQRFELRRAAAGRFEPFGVARIFIQVPDVSREESADPAFGRGVTGGSVVLPRGGEAVGRGERIHQRDLLRCTGERFADDALRGAGSGGGEQTKGQNDSKCSGHIRNVLFLQKYSCLRHSSGPAVLKICLRISICSSQGSFTPPLRDPYSLSAPFRSAV